MNNSFLYSDWFVLITTVILSGLYIGKITFHIKYYLAILEKRRGSVNIYNIYKDLGNFKLGQAFSPFPSISIYNENREVLNKEAIRYRKTTNVLAVIFLTFMFIYFFTYYLLQ